jgi:hypothetical protein
LFKLCSHHTTANYPETFTSIDPHLKGIATIQIA